MGILRLIGTAFLFLVIRQFLKLLVNAGQQTSLGSEQNNKNKKGVIDATFTRKE